VSVIFADGTGTCGLLNLTDTPSAAALHVQNYTDSAAWGMTLSRPLALDLTNVGSLKFGNFKQTGDLFKPGTCEAEKWVHQPI